MTPFSKKKSKQQKSAHEKTGAFLLSFPYPYGLRRKNSSRNRSNKRAMMPSQKQIAPHTLCPDRNRKQAPAISPASAVNETVRATRRNHLPRSHFRVTALSKRSAVSSIFFPSWSAIASTFRSNSCSVIITPPLIHSPRMYLCKINCLKRGNEIHIIFPIWQKHGAPSLR